MKFRILSLALAAGLAICALPAPATAKELEADALTRSLMKPAEFAQIALSPDGTKLALSRRLDDDTMHATIFERAGMKPLKDFTTEKGGSISYLEWLDDKRLIVGQWRYYGGYPFPVLMVAPLEDKKPTLLTREILSTVEGDTDDVLVRKCVDVKDSKECKPQVRRQKLDSKDDDEGELLIEGPVGTYLTLNLPASAGFATKWEEDGTSRLWAYKPADKTWVPLNDASKTSIDVLPVAVTYDGKTGYLVSEGKDGPDFLETYDFATGKRALLYADPNSDPMGPLLSLDRSALIGAWYEPTDPKQHFWNATHPDAEMYQQLQAAFPGQLVAVVDHSKDKNILVLEVSSDRDPGTWYIFDRKARKAAPVTRQHPWIEPKTQATQRSIELTSRDGKKLHGLLTLPPGSSGKNLPLVVNPHGGPFGVHDYKGYDTDDQVLAQHGYAVLQVNFRGSDGYGRAFAEAGKRQWGRAMQDDVTDATKWAIAQGVADPNRICIYGVSYGAYAALMGPIREPGLYKCVATYAGVSNLAKMTRWNTRDRRSDLNKEWIAKWVGEGPADLDPVSPALHADQIKVPVLIAHGYRDAYADVRHAQAMHKQLEKNHVPVDYIEYSETGHYLTMTKHREDFYARLLRLLDTNIGNGGGATATAAAQ
jgi:dipeptidyl aminopeptidase/acylaminoacyl peptidase